MAADDAAVTVSLRADLKGYEAALKTAVRQTERAAQAAEKAVSGIGKGVRPGNVIAVDFQKSAGQIANDARIMQFQLNDIFSGLASGQGIRAVQQQLGQIAQQMSGQTLGQGARTMGAALGAMINPINVAVVAFGLLASAAASYFFESEDGSKETEKALQQANEAIEKQKQLVRELAKEWKEAPQAVKDYAAELDKLEQIQKAAGGIAATKIDLLGPLSRELNQIGPMAEGIFKRLGSFSFDFDTRPFQASIKLAGDQFDKLMSQVNDGSITAAEIGIALKNMIATLRTIPLEPAQKLADKLEEVRSKTSSAVSEVGQLDKSLQHLGPTAEISIGQIITALGNMTGPLSGLITMAQQLGTAFPTDIGAAFNQGIVQMPETFRKAVTASGDAARAFLTIKSANKEVADSLRYLDDRMAISTAKLFTLLPETARITSAVRSPQKQAELYARHLREPGFQAARRSRHVPGQVTAAGTAVDIGAGVDMSTLRAAVKMVPELEQLDKVSESLYQKDKVHVQLAGTAIKINEEQARSIVQKAEADARANENLQSYLRSLDEHATLAVRVNEINTTSTLNADQKRIAIEVETELQKALNQARQDGYTLSQQDIDSIRAKATAVAQAGNAAIAISDAQQAAAKAAADATAKAKKEAMDQAQELQNLKNTIASMATSVLTGFVQDLRNGTDAAEALYNAVSRIADQLLQMALQKVFMMALGGFSGGGFVPNSSGGLYASGGYTGDKGRSQIAGVVHGGEYVINAAATQKHRALLEAINKGVPGYASGGFVLPRMSAMLRNQAATSQKPSSQEFNTRTTVVNTFDSGSFLSEALSRPDGVNVILNAVRAQPGAFRSAMNG